MTVRYHPSKVQPDPLEIPGLCWLQKRPSVQVHVFTLCDLFHFYDTVARQTLLLFLNCGLQC
jgi:hypothetical protein